jgi:hypothetical protein
MFLQSFRKPNRNVFEDKECLICLESLNVELNKIVELPCKCSNSVYHIDCLVRLLDSGQNKNFCPHCKTNYHIEPDQVVERQPHERQPHERQPHDRQPPERQPPDDKKYVYIFIVHILLNSFMNMINLGLMDDYRNVFTNVVSKILTVSYFCKILMNVCFVIARRDNNDRLRRYVGLSYIIQTVMLILLVCMLSSVEIGSNSVMLLANNVLFCLGELAFRIWIEYCL